MSAGVRYRRAPRAREHHGNDAKQHDERDRRALHHGAPPRWQKGQHDQPGGQAHRGKQPYGGDHHRGDGCQDDPESVHRDHCEGSIGFHGQDPVNVIATSTGADCTALTTAVEPCVFMPSWG